MADLASAVAELDTGQSTSQLLDELRAKTIKKSGIATSGVILSYLASVGKLTTIEDIANDPVNPLRNAAKAALITLQYREGLDFSLPETGLMLDAFGPNEAAVLTQVEVDAIKAMGDSYVKEFPNVAAWQIEEVRS